MMFEGVDISALTVYVADHQSIGYCNRISRRWAARHGLDYADYVRNGIAATRLLGTGDALAIPVVRAAVRRVHGR